MSLFVSVAAAQPLSVRNDGPSAGNNAVAHDEPASRLPDVEVVDTTPLPGLAVPRDAVPAAVQSTDSERIRETRPFTLGDLMNRDFAGAYVNEAQSNPWQPDVLYRGFAASPLLGNPIGLSVFVDGVRFNASFGDVVMWDLIPMAAIDTMTLIPGANASYGLNTLGGAIGVRTLDGRTARGPSATFEVGNHGRRTLSATHGFASDRFDTFISFESLRDGGWRAHSRSNLMRLFGKVGWNPVAATRIELSYAHGQNKMNGNGLVPESMLAADRRAVYTWPDRTRPRMDFVTLNGRTELADNWSLSAIAYMRRLRVTTANGDVEFDDANGVLDDSGYEGAYRSTGTTTTSTGLALQAARDGVWAGMRHRFAVGGGLDVGHTRFRQFEQEGGINATRGIYPTEDAVLQTAVAGRNRYTSVYVSDTVQVAPGVDVSVALRHQRANVRIGDESGEQPALDGDHSFNRTNPSVGVTWKLPGGVTAYGGYSEGFRVPTPVELTCADPTAPCSLPVAFVADPPLKPVVARSYELGVRGQVDERMRWNLGLFRTRLSNDIQFTSVGTSQGFFSNVPKTQREGLEAGLMGRAGRFDWGMNYTWLRATYRSDVALFNATASQYDPTVPAATQAHKGNRLPGIPNHLLKADVRYRATDSWSVGAGMQVVGGQYLRGDEANQQKRLGGYALVNLRTDYRVARHWRVFGRVDNLFDRRYATIGALNRNAFDANGVPFEGVGPGPVERFVSPGMSRSAWLGVEYRWAP